MIRQTRVPGDSLLRGHRFVERCDRHGRETIGLPDSKTAAIRLVFGRLELPGGPCPVYTIKYGWYVSTS